MSALAHKRIVTIGAGTGQRTLLAGLVDRHEEMASLTAIVAVTDNGGHSGELRTEFSVPAVGDGRQCLAVLAADQKAADHFDSRDDKGRSFGNMDLVNLIQKYGTISKAFVEAGKQLRCRGIVIPATDAVTHIAAELTDGSTIVGEWQIVERHPVVPIRRVHLEPAADAHADAVRALRQADVIIVTPGNFYTAVISALLPNGMADAVRQSHARLIYVINAMNFPGITDGWTPTEYINQLTEYARRPDAAIVNNGTIPGHVLKHYADRSYSPVRGPVTDTLESGTKILARDLVPDVIDGSGERPGLHKKSTHLLIHDPRKTTQAIIEALE